MKRKILILTFICIVLVLIPACDIKDAGSLKSLSHPYIAQYECIEARLGDEDLLEKFEFIKICLKDSDTIELSYKCKNEKLHTFIGKYQFDDKSGELTADIGILGCRFKQSTKIEDGKFSIIKIIGDKQLIMVFKAS